METLYKKIKSNWKNKEKLQEILVEILEEHHQVSEELSTAIAEFAGAFLSEKESSYKSTIAETEYRIKSTYGGNIERLRYQLTNLELLHKTVLSITTN